MSDATYAGLATPADSGSHFNIIQFIAKQLLAKIWTATLVKVASVNTMSKTVDIIPQVNQIDGQGNPWPHETIYGAPYIYFQGGVSAVQIDPAMGDIGLAVFADHDISSVIANSGQANPGSYRRFDPADAIYIGALPGLNPAPTQTITMNAGGITVTTPNALTINAASVAINCNVTVTGTLTATVDVVADGTSGHSHLHGGVTTGSGDTGAPI